MVGKVPSTFPSATIVALFAVLQAKGISFGRKDYEFMASIDQTHTAYAFEHFFRTVKAQANSIVNNKTSGLTLKSVQETNIATNVKSARAKRQHADHDKELDMPRKKAKFEHDDKELDMPRKKAKSEYKTDALEPYFPNLS